MYLTAYHDSAGNIIGLAASPADDSMPAEVVTKSQPELRATKIDVPSGVELDPADPLRLSEELGRLAKAYRVDRGSLARRS